MITRILYGLESVLYDTAIKVSKMAISCAQCNFSYKARKKYKYPLLALKYSFLREMQSQTHE